MNPDNYTKAQWHDADPNLAADVVAFHLTVVTTCGLPFSEFSSARQHATVGSVHIVTTLPHHFQLRLSCANVQNGHIDGSYLKKSLLIRQSIKILYQLVGF